MIGSFVISISYMHEHACKKMICIKFKVDREESFDPYDNNCAPTVLSFALEMIKIARFINVYHKK